jgi:hypothetical protein
MYCSPIFAGEAKLNSKLCDILSHPIRLTEA